MNTDFFLTIEREPTHVGCPMDCDLYHMAIYNQTALPIVRVFTSYSNPSEADMIEVGKAYA